ncbi:flagellar basal body rod protein FlgB [Desulfurobacterium atlanticum]|uniref:Flagellar basal body rod protein FlgB n=1 Tax=Desulfurobacterium atlanticum TaxID=240169 RepID=A0A238YZ95_9BACT|nr:flagellar basal body rod protein FlgB [Desulfurobacterium atlanticum]SNR76400.1 flagellar basal-body rod protein FlgB [Desulfurobacterium atlanticum]
MWKKLDSISEMASFYLERSKVIQGNIANADTPNYVPKDLVFEKHLTEQTLKLKKTDQKHIDPFPEEEKKFKIEELNKYSGYDKNKVNVDEELGKLAESAIMYRTLVQALKKELTKMKVSITGR